MENDMNQNELISTLIDAYTNLQRILSANEPKEEAEYQLKAVKAKLESFGIITTKLDR